MLKLGRIIVCLLLVFGVFAGIGAGAEAAASLHWQTQAVYYDDAGRIVIEGYFYNNGTVPIVWVNWFAVKVFFRNADSNWWLATTANFNGLNLQLYPGDSRHWTFYIYNARQYRFDYWQVNWSVNYNTQ